MSRKYLLASIGVAALYYGGAELGQTAAFAQNASAVWPPAGIGVGVVALMGFRFIPALVVGEILALATSGVSLGVAAGQFAGNIGEAALGGYLLRRAVGERRWFTRLRDVVDLVPIAAVAAAVSACFGVTSLYLADAFPAADYGTAWARWMLGDAASIILIVPAIAVLLRRSAPLPRRPALETCAVVLAVVVSAALGLVFWHEPTAFLVFLPLVWAALRFHQPGAAMASLFLGAVAVAAASHGEGPFAGDSLSGALNSSQLFVAAASVCGLVVAIIDSQRQSAIEEAKADRRSLERSEALLSRTERMARIGGWNWDLPTDEVTWSEETYRIYGVEQSRFDVNSSSFLERIHPEDREEADRLVRRGAAKGTGWVAERRIVTPDGEIRHVRGRAEAELDEDGKTVRLHGFEQDVTELVEAEQGLIEAEHRYRRLVERLPVASYVIEVYAGESWPWLFVSPQIEEMLGHPAENWLSDPDLWRRCMHPEDVDWVEQAEERGIATDESLAMEYRMIASDGRQLWVHDESVVRTEDDGRVYLDGILTEITERKEFESQLQHLADHDALTGLFNRRRFLEEVRLQMKLERRKEGAACLVMLDLDNFKYVNDSLGHAAGDELIRSIAALLRERLREVDTLARLGGDEFALLLRGTELGGAERVTEGLLESIRAQRHHIADEPVRITVSAGLTDLELPVDDAEDLLAAADVAMYEAKQRGRDRLAQFSPELKRQVERGRSWADRIRDALENDGFVLYEQPIVELAGRRVAQHEILLRMRGDDDEVIAPGAFLPVAERFDLVQAIDGWVTGRAIELMESWLERGRRLRLEVNLSGRSIVDEELIESIESRLEGSSIDPADLIFEVTETAAIANMERARAFSERLSALGCRFALDDFGSGFASFFYLKHLPVDFVKIDGDFVRGVTGSEVDQQVIRAMIGVTRALGQKTIAEFVTDEATLGILAGLGVDYAQGYQLGEPRPVEELDRAGARA